MHVLYALKLKLRLRINPVSKSFYCANKPYTMGLNLKFFECEKRTIKKQDRIITTLGPHYDADATKAVLEPY